MALQLCRGQVHTSDVCDSWGSRLWDILPIWIVRFRDGYLCLVLCPRNERSVAHKKAACVGRFYEKRLTPLY